MRHYTQHFAYSLFICVLSWEMDVLPFRRCLIEFTCVDDLANAALPGTPTAYFVTWSLQVRVHKHSCHDFVDFLQHRHRVQLGLTPPLWYNTSLRETFNFWRVMHARCVLRTKRPLETVSGIGCKERRRLSKAGVCAAGVASEGQQACAVAAALWEQSSGSQHALWRDNFYRRQFRRRFRALLVSDDVSLNCSVATVPTMPRPLEIYSGFPSLHPLLSNVGDVPTQLRRSHRGFCTAVQTIVEGPVPLKDIQCPLDVSRTHVAATHGEQFLLGELVVGAQRDFVLLMHILRYVQQHTTCILPLLVDKNTYYRICKIVHQQSYQR